MISRRKIIFALSLSPLAASFRAYTQQPGKVWRIGILRSGAPSDASTEGLKEGLRELGYVEGQNLAVEYRWAEGRDERLPDLAADLVGLKVDVIVATGGPPAVAAKQATAAIPIVMLVGGDPVEIGLVASLARPGANVTGLSAQSNALPGKWLALLKETVPKLSRVAVLRDPAIGKSMLDASQSAARSLGLRLQALKVERADDYAAAFAEARKHRAQAVVVLGSGLHFANRARIVELAAKHRLPAMYPTQVYVADLEGLMSYGPDSYALGRRAATYVDKILKGARPADLPVEQPTKFELVINMKAAKALGITIPPLVLLRADRVIE
jgi:putative ABC transport system substrate-binding protein